MAKPAPRPLPVNPAPAAANDGLAAGAPAGRVAAWLGLLLAVAFSLLFAYPGGAQPLQNMLLCLAVLLPTVVLALMPLANPEGREELRRRLVSPALLGAAGGALYALLRWRAMPIAFAGEQTVADAQWLAIAALLGATLPLAGRSLGLPAGATTRALLAGLALAGAIYGLLAIYQRTIGYNALLAEYQAQLSGPVRDLRTQSMLHALREQRVGGRLGNPNLFAAQLSVMGLLALALPLLFRKRWATAAGIAAWALCLAGVLLSGSRGGLLTCAVGTLAAGLLLVREGLLRRHVARRATVATLLGLGLLAALWTAPAWAEGVSLLERLGRSDTIRERLFYWQVALRIFEQHPLLGGGPGAFVLYYAQLKDELARESQYAHSWLFQLLAEQGLVGVLWAGLFWGGVLLAGWRAWRGHCREALVAACGACLLGINGLFEFSLQWREFQMLLGLLAGLAASECPAPQRATAPATTPGSPPRRTPAPSLVLVGLLFLCVVAVAPRMATRISLAQEARWQGQDALEYARSVPPEQRPAELHLALAAFRTAARHQPENPTHQAALASTAVALGQNPEPYFRRATQLNPLSAGLCADYGEWLWQAGRRTEALAQLDQAVRLYPSNVGHRLTRARCLLEAGQTAAAQADLRWVREHRLPVWEYELPILTDLERQAGLPAPPPATSTPHGE